MILASGNTITIIIWATFMVVTLILEMQTSDFVSIWLSFGALVALIATLLNAPIWLQVTLFLAVALLTIAITRPIAKKIQQKGIIRTNADKSIGMIATVTKEILPGDIGEVRLGSRYWSAKCADNETLTVGTSVVVRAISGVKLIVSKKKTEQEKEIISL